eukprot:gnl/TRDRNA2_/TRDRNA2_148101_c0_seq1.p1 gnl/TRDRNA2_/TRDRNA2_148101_c0~~gnl/TRDRNA2_/TRDRNA2_148101_c0_seq1.p1  ORF type:complete len:168 (-),score=5.86 gnl/TRDRNA2_/TRDRNA2_148101_c0_seq1:116-577(-)
MAGFACMAATSTGILQLAHLHCPAHVLSRWFPVWVSPSQLMLCVALFAKVLLETFRWTAWTSTGALYSFRILTVQLMDVKSLAGPGRKNFNELLQTHVAGGAGVPLIACCSHEVVRLACNGDSPEVGRSRALSCFLLALACAAADRAPTTRSV